MYESEIRFSFELKQSIKKDVAQHWSNKV